MDKLNKHIRILFIGQDWHGSNATSFKRAFRALGCDVLNINEYNFFPLWQSFTLRGLRKMLRFLFRAEFNRVFVQALHNFHPHLIFVFKGVFLSPLSLEEVHRIGAVLFGFYPDRFPFDDYRAAGNSFERCLPLYDVMFTPKSFHLDKLSLAGARMVEFLPYAYDPWCHFPVNLSLEEKQKFDSEVAFIGTWEKKRAGILESLVSKGFHHRLVIWGNQWEKLSADSPLRKFVKFKPANGMTQAKVFGATKIALAFLMPFDIHTARSFEIPAFETFMLAERTVEHTMFFEEGKEIACFEDVVELRDKIDYYLAHDDERKAIARAGYEKVTKGGNSYIDRAKRVLEVYREIANRKP